MKMTTSSFVPPLMTPAISSAMVSVGGTSGALTWPCPWLNAAAELKRERDTAARIIGVHLMDGALQCLRLYARLVSLSRWDHDACGITMLWNE